MRRSPGSDEPLGRDPEPLAVQHLRGVNLPPTPHRTAPDRLILLIACVAQFMVLLDVSIVNVALPSVGHDLDVGGTDLQWVVNAYVLTFAGFLLLGGKAADLVGRRRAYLWGLGLFTVASVIGGLAQNPAELIAARALQGVGGALLSPATLTIIITTFSGEQRTRAVGIWSSVAGAGGAAGSLFGGVLTSGLSWRWVFFVNLPIGAAALVAAVVWLFEARQPTADGQRLDIAGAVTVTAGLAALVYGVVGTATHPWSSTRTISVLAGAALLLGAFALVELYVAATPLVPFRVFRSRAFAVANLMIFLVGSGFFSLFYFLSLYLQNGLGYGAFRAGISFLPLSVVIVIGAQLSSRLVNRFGVVRVAQPGAMLMTAGFLWLSRVTVDSGYWTLVAPATCLLALAIGLLLTPLASAATSSLPAGQAGLASGVLNSSRQIGGALGLAVLTTLAAQHTSSVHASTVRAALVAGYDRAFLFAAGLGVAALVASLLLPSGRPDTLLNPTPAPRS